MWAFFEFISDIQKNFGYQKHLFTKRSGEKEIVETYLAHALPLLRQAFQAHHMDMLWHDEPPRIQLHLNKRDTLFPHEQYRQNTNTWSELSFDFVLFSPRLPEFGRHHGLFHMRHGTFFSTAPKIQLSLYGMKQLHREASWTNSFALDFEMHRPEWWEDHAIDIQCMADTIVRLALEKADPKWEKRFMVLKNIRARQKMKKEQRLMHG